MGGIETAKVLMGAGKRALDIANELKNVELKESILELREEILLLREENLCLKEKLKEKQKYNMQFSPKDNCYWNIKEDGTKEGPFCPKCYDVLEKPVRALKGGCTGSYYCPNCKTRIHTSEYNQTNECTFSI